VGVRPVQYVPNHDREKRQKIGVVRVVKYGHANLKGGKGESKFGDKNAKLKIWVVMLGEIAHRKQIMTFETKAQIRKFSKDDVGHIYSVPNRDRRPKIVAILGKFGQSKKCC